MIHGNLLQLFCEVSVALAGQVGLHIAALANGRLASFGQREWFLNQSEEKPEVLPARLQARPKLSKQYKNRRTLSSIAPLGAHSITFPT